MLSTYRENILIISEHVQILEQIFDSEGHTKLFISR